MIIINIIVIIIINKKMRNLTAKMWENTNKRRKVNT